MMGWFYCFEPVEACHIGCVWHNDELLLLCPQSEEKGRTSPSPQSPSKAVLQPPLALTTSNGFHYLPVVTGQAPSLQHMGYSGSQLEKIPGQNEIPQKRFEKCRYDTLTEVLSLPGRGTQFSLIFLSSFSLFLSGRRQLASKSLTQIKTDHSGLATLQ